MASVEDLLQRMRNNPHGMRFSEVSRVCAHFFGQPTSTGTSHRVYRTPWRGDPRINIQDAGGRAKAYQVRQVVKAIDKLRGDPS